jgi:hypothetical protein
METVDEGGMNENMTSSPIYPRLQCRDKKSIGEILIQSVLSPTALATGRGEGTRN